MYDLITRVLPISDVLATVRPLLEVTEDSVKLSRTIECRRYTFRGVPGKRIDVLIDTEIDNAECVAVEIAHKAGRYDGARRIRLTIRRWNPVQTCSVAPVRVEHNGRTLSVAVGDFSFTSDVLRSDLSDYEPRRLILWHARRYYAFLFDANGEDVFALADSFVIPEGSTLAEANRAASRELYRLARDAGWRKLTLREKARLGIPEDAPQWHRAEYLFPTGPSRYPRDGVSDATHSAAHWRG